MVDFSTEEKLPAETISYHDFHRKHPVMTYDNYSLFHDIFFLNRRRDLSWKIDRCGIDGIRLDCNSDAQHDKFISSSCNRRVCPHCASKQMLRRIHQFSPISDIARYAENKDSKYPHDWRVRFWTLTCKKSRPGESLRPVILMLKSALWRWWRYVYGERSQSLGGPYPVAGGLFCLEVGENWNIHYHGLIIGPKFVKDDDSSSKYKLSQVKKIWEESLEKAGWYGRYLNIKMLIPDDPNDVYRRGGDPNVKSFKEAVVETIAYPLDPDKHGKYSQSLLAHYELAVSGRNRTLVNPHYRHLYYDEDIETDSSGNNHLKPISWIPRYITKGAWYNEFHFNKKPALCPECLESGHFEQMSYDPAYDDFKGKRFQKNLFSYDSKGVKNFNEHAYFHPSKEEINLAIKHSKIPTRKTIS